MALAVAHLQLLAALLSIFIDKYYISGIESMILG
jgi:hypothetical protein